MLVGGTEEALAPIRHIAGPLIVNNLAQTQAMLEQAGAVITYPFIHTPNGAMRYAHHPDGNVAEYVQRLPKLVKRIVGQVDADRQISQATAVISCLTSYK